MVINSIERVTNVRRTSIVNNLRNSISLISVKFDASCQHYAGLRNLERSITQNSIIPCDSFEHYDNGRALSRRKRVLYLLWTIVMIVNTVKFSILPFYAEKWLIHDLGEFLYELYEMKMIALLFMACLFDSMPYLLFHYYLVRSSKFKTLEIFFGLINNSPTWRLNPGHTKKMNRITLIVSKAIEHQMRLIMVIIIGASSYLAYLAYTMQQE